MRIQPADDNRCEKNDGKKWRCRYPRFGRSRLCEKHHFQSRRHQPNGDPRSMVRFMDSGSLEANASIVEKPAEGAIRVSDPPIVDKKGRGRPPKAKSAGENHDVRVSGTSTENEKRRPNEAKYELRSDDDEDDDEWDEEEDDDWRASRARVSAHSVEMRKRGRPPKNEKRPVGRPPKRSGSTEIGMRGGKKEAMGDFELGQVWAFCEESDGLPSRSYAQVNGVVKNGSFVEVTPLVPHPISQEEVSFAKQGLSLTCGLFRASKCTLTKKVSAFTHTVLLEKDGRGGSYCRIFPKKGEIWAVYLQWDDLKNRFEYRLVEVVSDFNEEDGVTVFALMGFKGMDAVYRRQVHEGFHLVRRCSRSFMPMFSHQVPASRIVEGGETIWKVKLH